MLYSSSQVGMEAELYFTLVSLFFSGSLFLFLDIIFTLACMSENTTDSSALSDIYHSSVLLEVWYIYIFIYVYIETSLNVGASTSLMFCCIEANILGICRNQ